MTNRLETLMQAKLPDSLYRFSPLQSLLELRLPLLMSRAIRDKLQPASKRCAIAVNGLEISSDWLPPVYLCLRRLERLLQRNARYGISNLPYLVQVKEKFGDLRVYLNYPEALSAEVQIELEDKMEAIIAKTRSRLCSPETLIS